MYGINECMIAGNLTAAPVVRRTKTGKAVASFTVAANRKVGDREETDYIRCVAWDWLAQIVEPLTKGAGVILTGSQKTRSYEDAEGRKLYITEVVARAIGVVPAYKKTNEPDFRGGGNFEGFGRVRPDEDVPF